MSVLWWRYSVATSLRAYPPPSPPLPPSRASRVFNVTFVAREAGPFSQTIDIFTERGNIKVNVTANITVSSKEA